MLTVAIEKRLASVDLAVEFDLAAEVLALFGPSGAGKSPFVRAGLLPAVAPSWRHFILRPGPAPLLTARPFWCN